MHGRLCFRSLRRRKVTSLEVQSLQNAWHIIEAIGVVDSRGRVFHIFSFSTLFHQRQQKFVSFRLYWTVRPRQR